MDIWLEEIERDDLRMLKRWRNSPEIRLRAREYRLLNMVNQNDWFESMSRDRNNEMFLIMVDDKASIITPVGVCGLCNIDWVNRHAELSLYIGEESHKCKGIGSRVLTMLDIKAFNEFNLNKLWAEIYGFNLISLALFEKCGYVVVGTLQEHVFYLGDYYPSYIVERFADDRDSMGG